MTQAAELRFKTYGTFRKAERNGSRFTHAESSFRVAKSNREKYLADLGNKMSRFWSVFSPLVIIAALGLGYYQAYSVKTLVEAAIDPNSEGFNPVFVYLCVGAAISIVGMVIGHLLHEGIRRDAVTGSLRFLPLFWLALALSIFYVGFQFIYSRTGNAGVTEGVDYMSYAVLCFGIFELILGALLLEKALTYIALFFNGLYLFVQLRRMRRRSRKTNDHYRDYLGFLALHNQQAGVEPIEREGNDNIRRAIAFYSNIPINEGAPISADNNGRTSFAGRPEPPVSQPAAESKDATEKEKAFSDAEASARAFFADTTDDDLKV